MEYEEQELEESINIHDYLRILRKRKWLIIGCFVLLTLIAFYLTSQKIPIYQASGSLVVDIPRKTSPVTGDPISYSSYMFRELTFNTHLKLITSRLVLERVVTDLGLDREQPPPRKPEDDRLIPTQTFGEILGRVKRNLRILLKGEEDRKPLPPPDKMTRLVGELRGRIGVQGVRETLLMEVTARDIDPSRAAEIVNSLSKVYIQFDIANRLKSSRNTLSWMTDQLYEVKKRLEDAEAEFQAFKQSEKIFSFEGKQELVGQKIQEFNDRYLQTRNRRLEIDARLSKLRTSLNSSEGVHKARPLLDSELVDTLYSQLVELQVELTRMGKVFKEKHPKIIQVTSKIEETGKKLEEEIRKEIENLKVERSILREREDVLSSTLADFEKDAIETNTNELQYTILERNVQTNQRLYDTLLGKIKESDVAENLEESNLRIAEAAVVPRSPVSPNRKRDTLLGGVLGLFLGIGLAFLLEFMDRTIRTEGDVQQYLGIPVLSTVPEADNP